MARDLFEHVSRPFDGAGARSRYTVPFSLGAHTLAVTVVVVAPLLAADALPALHGRLVYADYTPVVPQEPPRPPAYRSADELTSRPDPNAAPTAIPVGITKEPDWQDHVFHPPNTVSIVDGSVEDGLQALQPPAPQPPRPAPTAPVRVGVGISVPTKVYDVPPVYPAMAQAARVHGVVIIQATIGVDGAVVDATLLRSVPLLDAAALDAVRQWRYTPSRLNGVPVAVVMTVTVNFQLR